MTVGFFAMVFYLALSIKKIDVGCLRLERFEILLKLNPFMIKKSVESS